MGLRGLKGSKDWVKGVCFHVNHRLRLFILEAGHSCSAPGEPRGTDACFPGHKARSNSALGGASSHFCFTGRTRVSQLSGEEGAAAPEQRAEETVGRGQTWGL